MCLRAGGGGGGGHVGEQGAATSASSLFSSGGRRRAGGSWSDFGGIGTGGVGSSPSAVSVTAADVAAAADVVDLFYPVHQGSGKLPVQDVRLHLRAAGDRSGVAQFSPRVVDLVSIQVLVFTWVLSTLFVFQRYV